VFISILLKQANHNAYCATLLLLKLHFVYVELATNTPDLNTIPAELHGHELPEVLCICWLQPYF
jgi:hypothetical protein